MTSARPRAGSDCAGLAGPGAQAVPWAGAADLVDSATVDRGEAAIAALRCRRVAAETAETVLWRSDHALGPAPLALEEDHAARVADLRLYVRQEHAERDQAALGRALVAGAHGAGPW